MTSNSNRAAALAIWKAGVQAVQPERLIAQHLRLEDSVLHMAQCSVDLSDLHRIVVVGGGKASAGLATSFDALVGRPIRERFPNIEVVGLVNCPAGTFDDEDQQRCAIQLIAARPAGENIPTRTAVESTERMLELVSSCGPQDLVVCLLSGGGSALLTAPIDGITLEDKQAVARVLAAAGANIEQLNTVRRALSRVKGGGLADACRAPRLVTLVLSDVLGDDLATIASGPTSYSASASPTEALKVLAKLDLLDSEPLQRVVACLKSQGGKQTRRNQNACQVDHIVLGNNASAVQAAAAAADEMGFSTRTSSAPASEPDVAIVADLALEEILAIVDAGGHACWISGGEPTVNLPDKPGKGGRNQQLALELMDRLTKRGWPDEDLTFELCFVSGGTDGEDGPTDAAGGYFDAEIYRASQLSNLDRQQHLDAANAYPFLERLSALLQTGPSGTNVCDLRVCVVGRPAADT